jgi:predicted transcriptional regulator
METAVKGATVRVSPATHRVLRELAAESGESMMSIIEQAIERYRRERWLEEANQEWAAIQADPQAKAESAADQALWDSTLGDGLEKEAW